MYLIHVVEASKVVKVTAEETYDIYICGIPSTWLLNPLFEQLTTRENLPFEISDRKHMHI